MYKYLSKKQKIGLWIGMTIPFLFVLSLPFSNYLEDKEIQKKGIETTATVFRYRSTVFSNNAGQRTIYLVECSYQVNNETYRCSFHQDFKNPKRVPLGETFQIKYLPEEPWKWVWADEEKMKKYLE